MEAISVVISVRGEDVTFTEPSFRDLPKIISTLRGVFSGFKFDEGVDGLEIMLDVMSKEETFAAVSQILSAMSGKDAEFFDSMTTSDAVAIFEGFKNSDLEKVARRFFTKVTKSQQATD